MKIKTAELIGAALDWAVAKCEEENVTAWWCTDRSAYFVVFTEYLDSTDDLATYNSDETYYPSSDWAQGGPIIERERISIAYEPSLVYADSARWKSLAAMSDNDHYHGPTPLIAAMRCYVASKLGDEVEVPDEVVA